MKVIPYMQSGYFKENTYVLVDEKTGCTAIVDPGFEDVSQINQFERMDYILLTHGHFDHIAVVPELVEKFSSKVVSHKAELEVLMNHIYNLSVAQDLHYEIHPDFLLEDGDIINLGETKITAMHVPGHTVGSCCYIADENIFTGDVLMKGRIGRTDLPTNNYEDFLKSVSKIKALEGDYAIYGGHGEPTSLQEERLNNPYLSDNPPAKKQ